MSGTPSRAVDACTTAEIGNREANRGCEGVSGISVVLSPGLYFQEGEGSHGNHHIHKVISLLEVLSGERLSRERGSQRFHQIHNVQAVLNFLERRRILLVDIRDVDIRAVDIVDGEPKLIVGLLWTLILHYRVSKIVHDGSRGKDALLKWVGEHKNVKDFHKSWTDGLAFVAILRRHKRALGRLTRNWDQLLEKLDADQISGKLIAKGILNHEWDGERDAKQWKRREVILLKVHGKGSDGMRAFLDALEEIGQSHLMRDRPQLTKAIGVQRPWCPMDQRITMRTQCNRWMWRMRLTCQVLTLMET
ncbi:unnamed protein product [Darwinula stevensoni]|uniref:Calponin-homology (CH) domain-containing protein n=1 Tax=Darwinula stevensoni TaxID=69355 RepID=A0A7R9FSC4_9CRUS|nr:unnamed protein product [Darwinula stevensoni]CAG0902970.1 unnamed protein product [Darwinula stevensoni]